MEIIHHEIGRDPLYKIWNYPKLCMIIYFYSDGGKIVFQDNIYPIKKGVLCFIDSFKRHYTMPSDPEVYNRSKIFADQKIVNGILELASDDSEFAATFLNSSVVYAKIPDELQPTVEGIYKKAFDNKGDKANFISCFFELMLYLKKYVVQKNTYLGDNLTKVLEYINNSYQLPLTLDDICKRAHISKYHFCRKFKTTFGITLMEYLLQTRIAAAKTMLVTTDNSINIVSEKCGFSSVSYFCQIFKKRTGLSPNQYRTKNKNI